MNRPWVKGLSAVVGVLLVQFGILASICAQNNVHQEYALCFLGDPNAPANLYPDSISSIYLGSFDDTAHVTITCKAYPSYARSFVLPPRTHIRYEIWRDLAPSMFLSEVVDDKCVLVTSDLPVFCGFQTTVPEAPGDFALALPKDRRGGGEYAVSYVVVTAPQDKYPGHKFMTLPPSAFMVAAFEDGTDVFITPSCRTLNGSAPLARLHYTLDRGQAVQIYSAVDSYAVPHDLSGSLIWANNPIAVYGANSAASIPNSYNSWNASSDNGPIIETLPSVSNLGSTFVCRWHAPRLPGFYLGQTPEDSIYDVLKVAAAFANTRITINGEPWVTLNSGEYRDTTIRGVYVIRSSQPVLAAQFDHSQYASEPTGGPAMALIPPLEQRTKSCTFVSLLDLDFFANGFWQYADHYIVVVGDRSIKNSLLLDGEAMPDTGFVTIPEIVLGDTVVVGSYSVSPGFHTLSTTDASSKGFTLLAYGASKGLGYAYGIGSEQSSKSVVLKQTADHDNTLTCYPNPIARGGTLHVQLPDIVNGNLWCEWTDILGREIKPKELVNCTSGAFYVKTPSSTDMCFMKVSGPGTLLTGCCTILIKVFAH